MAERSRVRERAEVSGVRSSFENWCHDKLRLNNKVEFEPKAKQKWHPTVTG